MLDVQKILKLFATALLCFSCLTVELSAPPSRILFVSIPFPSHVNVLIAIARALPSHHHVAFAVFDVNVQAVHDALDPHRPLSIVSLGALPNEKPTFEPHNGESNIALLGRAALPIFIGVLYAPMHDALLSHLKMHSYDMMVLDMFAFAAQDLAHDLNIPMIVHSATPTYGVLNLPAWVPREFDVLTQQHLRNSFLQRFYEHIVVPFSMIYHLGPHMFHLNELRRKLNRTASYTVFGLSSPTQRWQGHPILISRCLSFEFRRAYTPNYHFIGFIILKRTINETDYTDETRAVNVWLNRTRAPEEFVVLVAFGTLSKVNEKVWQALVDTVQLVPNMHLLLTIPDQVQRIRVHALLKSLLDQQSRVLVVSWINQQDVLTHSSLRMFITHGGLNSIGEAVHAHVPLLVLPGFADQPANAAKVQEAKIGYALERSTITATKLAIHIKQIHAEHDVFIRRLIRMHQLSELEGGAQRAATLIDQWLLVGYAHLDTLEHQLPSLVATSLDVRLAFFALLILINYLLFRFVSSIACTLSRRVRKCKQE